MFKTNSRAVLGKIAACILDNEDQELSVYLNATKAGDKTCPEPRSLRAMMNGECSGVAPVCFKTDGLQWEGKPLAIYHVDAARLHRALAEKGVEMKKSDLYRCLKEFKFGPLRFYHGGKERRLWWGAGIVLESYIG